MAVLHRHGGSRYAALLTIVSVATAIRIAFLLRNLSLTTDEATSVVISQLPWHSFIAHLVSYEANMAVYYLALRSWLLIGSSEGIVRALSVVLSLLAVVALYVLTTRLFGTRAGLLSATLLALNATHIEYGGQARAYGLYILLSVLTSLVFCTAVERPTGRRWTLYAFLGAITAYTHFYAVLTLVSHYASLLALGLRRVPWRWVMASGVLLTVLLLPAVLFVLLRDVGQVSLLGRPGVSSVIGALAVLSGGIVALPVYAFLCAVAVVGAWRDGVILSPASESVKRWRYAFLICWLIIPIVVAVAISFVRPTLAFRYLLGSVPPLGALAAVGLARLGLVMGTTCIVLILGLSAHVLKARYEGRAWENWSEATRLVQTQAKFGDAVFIFAGHARPGFEYYSSRYGDGGPPIVYPQSVLAPVRRLTPAHQDLVRQTLERLPGQYARVWLVLSDDDDRYERVSTRYAVSLLIRGNLSTSYRAVQEHRFRGVTVLLFAAR